MCIKLIALPEHHIFTLEPKVSLLNVLGMPRKEVEHALQVLVAVEEQRCMSNHLAVEESGVELVEEGGVGDGTGIAVLSKPLCVQLRQHIHNQVAQIYLINCLCDC